MKMIHTRCDRTARELDFGNNLPGPSSGPSLPETPYFGSPGFVRGRVSVLLIFRRPLYMIDDQHLYWSFGGDQLESELFLDSREERCTFRFG